MRSGIGGSRGAIPPKLFSIYSYFVLWEAVSQTKNILAPTILPRQFWAGHATAFLCVAQDAAVGSRARQTVGCVRDECTAQFMSVGLPTTTLFFLLRDLPLLLDTAAQKVDGSATLLSGWRQQRRYFLSSRSRKSSASCCSKVRSSAGSESDRLCWRNRWASYIW